MSQNSNEETELTDYLTDYVIVVKDTGCRTAVGKIAATKIAAAYRKCRGVLLLSFTCLMSGIAIFVFGICASGGFTPPA